MRFSINRSTVKIERRFVNLEALLLALVLALTVATSPLRADTGTCSGQSLTLPFTDVPGSNPFFCFIAELYFLGITLGTSPTTYSPTAAVTRDGMAAFLDRTHDSAVKRGSRRAALNQFWTTTPQYDITVGNGMLGTTATPFDPRGVASDGADIWVANNSGFSVSRVRASDGRLLETWTNASAPFGVLVALGRVFVTGLDSPGKLYMIDPSQPVGDVTTVADTLGNLPFGIAFDGARIWTANLNSNNISIITLGSRFTVTNVGGFSQPYGIIYDGANIWVTNSNGLVKLNSSGGVIQTVTVGGTPRFPVYDGTNIWVPNATSNSVSVVRPSDGTVLATLTGNGLSGPRAAAFDGQRILVTNILGHSVSLWKAADFTPLGSFATGAGSSPAEVCSDGLNFWITLTDTDKLARF
jgi:hypothetical protein